MAKRNRRSAGKVAPQEDEDEAEEMEQEQEQEQVQEQEEEQADGRTLNFNEALSWRAGKAIPVTELLRRLKDLNSELQVLEQDVVERTSLMEKAKELASHNLMAHKDRGIKAYTACCLVEMFRLCAPDAPYTASQLKEIFFLIVTGIIPALSDSSNPYNTQHLQVLKSLAEVKSFVLLSDIPSSSELMHNLFESCFDVLSGPSKAESGKEMSKNIEYYMTTILTTLVDESQGLSPETVDVVLAQFLRADPRTISHQSSKGKKLLNGTSDEQQLLQQFKEAPPAYNMAKNVCNATPTKMSRYVLNYFSQVLLQLTTGSAFSTSGEGPGEGPSEDELKESSKAHNMLRELWRSCPGVLSDIIPQLEQELGAEDLQLRLLATETMGDMISGIGAAGPPPSVPLNPSAYPSQSLVPPPPQSYNFLSSAHSPVSFSARHPQPYQSFLNRHKDRSPLVRAAWTTAIGRILMTNAGRVGLDNESERLLLSYLRDMLVDSDEKVRLNAVRSIETLGYDGIIKKVGSMGSVSDEDSVLSALADRVKDRKPQVRAEALKLLAKIWGVGAGAIFEEDERVSSLLGPIPSRILEAYYVNEPDLSALIDRALYETLLPLDYPPIKAKATQPTNGASTRKKSSQTDETHDGEAKSEVDIDRIRAERELVLIRDLEPRAKSVLWAKGNPKNSVKFMSAFLAKCEEYNGGVVDGNEQEVKDGLGKLINVYAKLLPDSSRASDELWRFAKLHDRRSYVLMKFCIDPESDYRKIQKSFKELKKRLENEPKATSSLVEYLTTMLYGCSVLLFNRSHVPAVIEISRSNEKSLGATAHELLKEMSNQNPEVFKAHIQDLCKNLESEAPSKSHPNGPGAVLDLRACSGFLKNFPSEAPKDRKFSEAMHAYALYGSSPEAAKYAVSILMTIPGKRDLFTKQLLAQCIKGFRYGENHFIARSVTLSQLMLLGSRHQADSVYDDVSEIAISQVLLHPPVSTEAGDSTSDGEKWSDEPDEDCVAKLWALKLLVNRVRACKDDEDMEQIAEPIFKFLNNLITSNGALPGTNTTPPALRARLRLQAAELLLKLCSTSKKLDTMLSPAAFNQLALVAQDAADAVRLGFVDKVKKYLGRGRLTLRFYAVLFLLAFEPTKLIKERATTFLRARAAQFRRQRDTAMEAVLARLLSLLAHHPDMDTDPENIKDQAQYIIFYLQCVADKDNLGLIYHVAQRVKGVRDGIDNSAAKPTDTTASSEKLYVLSELTQSVVRCWEEDHGWTMQTYPARVKLPAGLFATLANHEIAQDIARKQFLDQTAADLIPEVVKRALRHKKKRKHDAANTGTTGTRGGATKRARVSEATPGKLKKSIKKRNAKTPKARRMHEADETPSSARRRSGRAHKQANYIESSDEEGNDDDRDEVEEDEDVEDDASVGASGGENGDEDMRDVAAAPDSEADDDAEDGTDARQDEPEARPGKAKGKKQQQQLRRTLVSRPAPSGRAKATAKGKGKAKKTEAASSPLSSAASASKRPKTGGRGGRHKVKEKDVMSISSDETASASD